MEILGKSIVFGYSASIHEIFGLFKVLTKKVPHGKAFFEQRIIYVGIKMSRLPRD